VEDSLTRRLAQPLAANSAQRNGSARPAPMSASDPVDIPYLRRERYAAHQADCSENEAKTMKRHLKRAFGAPK
jgi:hypothetical protein